MEYLLECTISHAWLAKTISNKCHEWTTHHVIRIKHPRSISSLWFDKLYCFWIIIEDWIASYKIVECHSLFCLVSIQPSRCPQNAALVKTKVKYSYLSAVWWENCEMSSASGWHWISRRASSSLGSRWHSPLWHLGRKERASKRFHPRQTVQSLRAERGKIIILCVDSLLSHQPHMQHNSVACAQYFITRSSFFPPKTHILIQHCHKTVCNYNLG